MIILKGLDGVVRYIDDVCWHMDDALVYGSNNRKQDGYSKFCDVWRRQASLLS